MAFIHKLTFVFDEPKQGWSETWYQQRITNNPLAALDEMLPVATARAKLLGDQCILSHTRAAVVTDLASNTHLTRLSQGRDTNLFADQGAGQTFPQHESLLVRCIPIDRTLHKDVYLGGCPKKIAGTLRQYAPSAFYDSLFQAWANTIRQNHYGWLHQTILNDVQITDWIMDDASGKTTFTLSGPITFTGNPPKRRVTVTIPGGNDSLDGVYVVQPTGPNTPNQVVTVKPRPTHPYDQRIGRMVSYNYTFVDLFSTTSPPTGSRIDGQRLAKRARGRPLYAERGRRPVVGRF